MNRGVNIFILLQKYYNWEFIKNVQSGQV